MTRRTRRRIVLAGVAVGVLIWLVACAWLVLDAQRAAADGEAELRAIRQQASISQLMEPAIQTGLDNASEDFDHAAQRLSSPILAPLRVVPVLGRQLRAVDRVTTSAAEGTAAASVALADLVELSERPQTGGPARLVLLGDLAEVASTAQAALDGMDIGSPEGLTAPLADAVEELEERRTEASEAAGKLEAVSLALKGLLSGPDSYLLLGANNAEMRNGSGMFLSASELQLGDGRLTLGSVEPTAELVLPEGTVPVDGDLAANWPWLDPGRDLRNLGLTADFPQSAAVAVDTWEATEVGGPVAGVLAIDVEGVRSLLRAVGSVEVDGVEYTADTVQDELLREQYRRFEEDQDARRDQLSEVTKAIFERLEAGKWEFESLATELADAVAGRHLLVWSRDTAAEDAWRSVQADGHLQEDSVNVALLNRSGTKIDSWIATTVDFETTARSGGGYDLRIRYDIVNDAPGAGPRYLVGPYVEGLAAGDHVGLAVVNLPAGTTDVEMTGAEPFLAGGDGPTVVVGGEVTIRRGESAAVEVTARLPDDLERVVVEPSARVPLTGWTVDGKVVDAARRFTIVLAD